MMEEWWVEIEFMILQNACDFEVYAVKERGHYVKNFQNLRNIIKTL